MRDTKQLKAAREAEHNPYARRFAVAKWNGSVTVCDVPKLFARLPEFDGWTKAQHTAMAIEYAELAQPLSNMWAHLVSRANYIWGDGNGVLVSGVYREHFPQTIKAELRTLAHAETDYWGRSLAHWLRSGRRLNTWRRDLRHSTL